MKKLILSSLLAIGMFSVASAQTSITNVESGSAFLDSLTNFAVVGYGTYAPEAPTKVGGGALLVYNVSQNIGAMAGIDWLGSFSMVSGQITFKVPTHPLTFIGLPNVTFTPNVLGGIATPMSGGASGHLSGVVGAGGSIDLFKLGKGNLAIGYEAVSWTDAGAYSGLHHEGFLSWHVGF